MQNLCPMQFPRFDGIVVAKEMEEIVLEAWQVEQQLSIEKDIKVLGGIHTCTIIKGVL